jgi:DNA-binding transcriptional ArsR family regulator
MAKHSHSLDATFFALGDSTRRGMLERLSRGEASMSQLAEPFGVSLPTIHKHLRVLERAGFVAHEKRGRVRHVRLAHKPGRQRDRRRVLNFLPMREAKNWIAQFEARWDDRLQRLKQQVESDL